MGYVGKLEEKIKAQELRKQGLSYKEILQHIHVSKDTLNRWCKDIVLTKQQKANLLAKKKFGQQKGSLVAAENKRKQRKETIVSIYREAIKDVGLLYSRDLFMIGIALYAAEGTKMDKYGGFTNADPQLIKFMSRWFVQFAKVPQYKLRGRIWIHEEKNEQNAKKFWSTITQIPENQFIKSYITVKKKSKKIRKNIHDYGIFSITFSDATIHRKIMGWISHVFSGRIS